ncbi:MAG: M20/M25/M40 family metallo-hydrolase [Tidjanibacter sp.]|nr:M20/M25/M40 family metallo-hydrolase [Tidjanibacter sp.]
MKRLLTLLVVLGATLTVGLAQDIEKQLRSHVEYLTSDALAGRKAGSEGAEAAAAYIEKHFDSTLHLPTRLQYFTVTLEESSFCNVIARIEGVQPGKYIVIGAHYDHLGTKRGKIYHGADDNASGTAALLEVARSFTRRNYKPQYTLLFVAFDAEELGLYGSKAYVEKYHLTADNVKAMINMDMVGWLKDGALNIEGTGTLNGSEEAINRLATKHSLVVETKNFETSRLTGTDTEPFALQGIPTLSLNTGMKSPYHKPEDTADKIDYEGLAKITNFVGDLVVEIDKTNSTVASSGKVARKHRANTLDIALAYGAGSTHQHIPNAAIDGRPDDCWHIGLTAQYALRHFGLRASVLYDKRTALAPADVNNIYGPAATLGLKSVTVPAELMLKTKGKSCLYIAGGGYYSWIFESRLDGEKSDMLSRGIDSTEYGLQWSLGGRLSSFYIELTRRYSLVPLSQGGMMPTVYNRSSLCSMGIFF